MAKKGTIITNFPTVGSNGYSDDRAYSVAVQSDGKILVAGYTVNAYSGGFALARYNSNGSLDTHFDGDGKVTTTIGRFAAQGYSVAVQTDGKILLAGASTADGGADFALARYNGNGSLDKGFDGDGIVTTPINPMYADNGRAVAVQTDGKILLAGSSHNGNDLDFALVRYNKNGSLDNSFSADGKATTAVTAFNDYGQSVAIQADGKILVAGSSYNGSNDDFSLVRYNKDGSLDRSFSQDGMVITAVGTAYDEGYAVAVQKDGKILVAGYSWNSYSNDFAVVRYNSNGTLDTSFGNGGIVITPVGSFADQAYALTIQANGKILVAGSSWNGNTDVAVVRYNSNGSLDVSFDGDGKVITAIGAEDDIGRAVTVQEADGKILVAGESYTDGHPDFALVRYRVNGSLDTTFTGTATSTGKATLNDQTDIALLMGSKNADVFNGGVGNDTLNGRGGDDTLSGGPGHDSFVFNSSNAGIDRILDFKPLDDTIKLENKVFTALSPGLLEATDLTISNDNHDNAHIIYNPSTGALLYDADGIGALNAVQIATLGINLALSANNFIVI